MLLFQSGEPTFNQIQLAAGHNKSHCFVHLVQFDLKEVFVLPEPRDWILLTFLVGLLRHHTLMTHSAFIKE